MSVDWTVAMQAANKYRGSEGDVGALADGFISLHSRFVSRPLPLTRRESEVLRFIAEHIDANGFAPTQGEIATHFHYSSTATVSELVGNLHRKRWIIREFNKARAIVVVHWPSNGESA